MSEPYDILITPSSFGECGDQPLQMLNAAGLKYKLNPFKRKLTEFELIPLAQDCCGVIAGVERYSDEVMSQLPKLKVISRCGVGMDSIDLEKAKARKIEVLNTPHGPIEPVAELTMGLILSGLRGISFVDGKLKNGKWTKFNGWLLNGKTVGIVGFGKIGRRVAELLKPFHVKLLFFDPFVGDDDISDPTIQKCEELSGLLSVSDVITLHLKWDESSTSLIGSRELSMMKKDAYIVNVARGGVIDEVALYDALSKKIISGAALDVFEKEPYEGKLRELDQVILTPHIGSYAREAKFKMEVQAVDNLIQAILKGPYG